jgi:hypothetical protein
LLESLIFLSKGVFEYVAQKWHQKATVQTAIVTGAIACISAIVTLVIARNLERTPEWFRRWTEKPQSCQNMLTERMQLYEAESADLFGDAATDIEHAGYSGKGYVSGYGGRPGTATTFLVDVPSAGEYQVVVCYANGTRGVKTLTIYVNNELVKQTRLSNASRWNIWMTKTEPLPLKMGLNSISYRKNFGDNGDVNLDFIGIEKK